jgi:IPT/TIG domain
MAFFKRPLGLRTAAVAVVSALVVLGLETPASASSPTISSFSPTSGPAGCVVVITGTSFKDPIVTSVDIGGTPVSAFMVVSGTEIWATVAGDASGTIHVTNASATASSPSDFTNANPGGCSPTITLITPCTGFAGVVVTILGTNLLKSSGTVAIPAVGGNVRFAPYTATATHTGAPETPQQLSVLVPPCARSGQDPAPHLRAVEDCREDHDDGHGGLQEADQGSPRQVPVSDTGHFGAVRWSLFPRRLTRSDQKLIATGRTESPRRTASRRSSRGTRAARLSANDRIGSY